MTATDERDTRDTMSFRLWVSSQDKLKGIAKAKGMGHTTLTGDVMEVAMGYITCSGCHATVPVRYGDLAGTTFLDAAYAAVKEVYKQKCWEGAGCGRQPAHTAVLVGAEPVSQPSPSPGTEGQAATGNGDAGGRTEPPAPAPVKARKARSTPRAAHSSLAAGPAPVPSRTVVIERLRDQIEGIAPGTVPPAMFAPGLESGPEDCLHPRVRIKGPCPDCGEWIGGRR